MTVARRTSKEGHRCGEQYLKDGSFSAPRELLEVPPGEVVIAHEVVDFQRERPAWRLYMIARVMGAMADALNWQDIAQVRSKYEAASLETAWGALYFAVEQPGVLRPERVARRLQAMLRFWEPLQSTGYLFKAHPDVLTLDELMTAACEWAMNAWCPVDDRPVRTRLELAAERMARATKEDCMQAILREMPRALGYARGLKHGNLLANPSFLRERLEMLSPEAFERVSGACTSDLLGLLYAWDRDLGKQ